MSRLFRLFGPLLALSFLLVPTSISAAIAGEELLARSIAHHDPSWLWGAQALELSLEESRADGSTRKTKLMLDPRAERFTWWSQRGDHLLEGALDQGECSLALDGSSEISEQEKETHRLTCERLTLFRDYYSYLWGLPMKLRDPGTLIGADVLDTEFNSRTVQGLRVTYTPEVGDDIWYFYFDPETSALVGYRFYHDEAANDGEYIVLEGEVSAGGLKLPKARTWYTHGDDRILGTDTLTDLSRADD
jgi:hypothetical protein